MPDRLVRVALVTGASRGVGAEVARILGQRGLDVIVHYRSKQRRAQEVADAIRTRGAQAITAAADLTSETDRRQLVLRRQHRLTRERGAFRRPLTSQGTGSKT